MGSSLVGVVLPTTTPAIADAHEDEQPTRTASISRRLLPTVADPWTDPTQDPWRYGRDAMHTEASSSWSAPQPDSTANAWGHDQPTQAAATTQEQRAQDMYTARAALESIARSAAQHGKPMIARAALDRVQERLRERTG